MYLLSFDNHFDLAKNKNQNQDVLITQNQNFDIFQELVIMGSNDN